MKHLKDFFHTINYVFFRRIRNIIRWIPILWKDTDWSNYSIFTVLEVKIRQVRNYIQNKKRHPDWEKDVRWMNISLSLIEKVKTEYYNVEHMDYDTKIYINKNKLIYNKVKKEQPNRADAWYAVLIARHKHIKAKALLFKVLNNHIENWWD